MLWGSDKGKALRPGEKWYTALGFIAGWFAALLLAPRFGSLLLACPAASPQPVHCIELDAGPGLQVDYHSTATTTTTTTRTTTSTPSDNRAPVVPQLPKTRSESASNPPEAPAWLKGASKIERRSETTPSGAGPLLQKQRAQHGSPLGNTAPVPFKEVSYCHRQLQGRIQLASVLLNNLQLTGIGVESGTNNGEFSEALLKTWKGQHLHLIDSWIGNNADYDRAKMLCSDLFPNRCTVHRKGSPLVAKLFQPASVDFVYIDVADYDNLTKELELWWPVLKEGGLLAGHDFVPDGVRVAEVEFAVQKAVHDFAGKVGREIQSIATKNKDGGRQEPQHVDGGWTTWYFFK